MENPFKHGGIINGPCFADQRFILGWFKKGGYWVDPKAVVRILDIGADVLYNSQQLCHTLWGAAIES